MTTALYVIIAILILGVIIAIHELGHYLAGRLLGFGIVEYSIGMGPRIFGWERKGIQYSLRAIPLGGFCKFVGEDERNTEPNAFNNMPVWKRFITILSGPAMNFVLAYLAAVVTLMVFGVGTVLPIVDQVVADTPAAAAQLQSGDIVLEANGTEISYDYEGVELFRSIIQRDDEINIVVERDGDTFETSLVPAIVITDESTGETAKQIGVNFSIVAQSCSLKEAIPDGAQYMIQQTQTLLDFLKNLIFKFEGTENVSGTVGTVAVVSEVIQSDARQIWYILFIISLNLGIMNLLPLPALDGGRLLLLIVEGIRRKPLPPEKEGMVHAIGFLLLMILFVVLTFQDIRLYILK